jgi:hypothetical protein
MSSTSPRDQGPPPDSPSDVRALPARPNLEFERKQAKKLLAQLHQGDPDALARVHAKMKRSADTKPDEFQLSDAQFTIAREYGFTSWPRLVEYFETLDRHELSGARERWQPASHHEAWARTLIVEHKEQRLWTIPFLTRYVPRFYGRTPDQVFASEVTVNDARLATARMHRYPSWEVMVAEVKPTDAWVEHDTPLRKAMTFLRAGDFDGLKSLVDEYPELLSPAEREYPRSETLARNVLLHDLKAASPESRRIYDWLKERMDLTITLNFMLLGYMRMTREEMQRLLDLGADPDWVPPNGYSVLEHVIWRCWSGEVVDLIAARVKPREGFWISAGLGDAKAVAHYFDGNGRLRDDARKTRPDFTALGPLPMPSDPAPDDEVVIWEAFLVAAFNQRFGVLDVLLDRGFNIDYIGWGQTILHLAVGNGWLPLVEFLVRRGANLDLKGWRPHMSARESAEEHAMNPHGHANAHRILEICGGRDIATLRRERDEKRAKQVMQTAPSIEMMFNNAKQDAVHQGLGQVSPGNLFIGLLREGRLVVALLGQAGVDLGRLRSLVAMRLDAPKIEVPAEMTADPECAAILMDAREIAEQRKEALLISPHVLMALVRRAPRQILELIESAGGSREKVLAAIELVLPKQR